MKRVVIVLLSGVAAFGLPWFHTRPKPVLFDEPVAAQHPVASRNAHSRAPSKKRSDDDPPRKEQGTPQNPAAGSSSSVKPGIAR